MSATDTTGTPSTVTRIDTSKQDPPKELAQSRPPPAQKTSRFNLNNPTEWLIDQRAIGSDYEFPPKKRRFVHLRLGSIYANLVELYHHWFVSIWSHLNRTVEEYGLPGGDTPKSLRLARAYISSWILDLYYYIRRSVAEIDTTAYASRYSHPIFQTTVQYDAYLADLLNAIRPTHILHTTADELLIPLMATQPNWESDNPFNIPHFFKAKSLVLAVNRIVVDKKLCCIGKITDSPTGNPSWLFDLVTHDATTAYYAWFPAEGNYTSAALVLAFIIGCACSPRIGLTEVDEWRWFPKGENRNWIAPRFDGHYIGQRHNYGAVELTEIEYERDIPIPNFYATAVPTVTSGPFVFTAPEATHHQELSADENTEIPGSPTLEAEHDAPATADNVIQTGRYRYVTKIYYAQVARGMSLDDRYSCLLEYLRD
jgi:hypothetical protein